MHHSLSITSKTLLQKYCSYVDEQSVIKKKKKPIYFNTKYRRKRKLEPIMKCFYNDKVPYKYPIPYCYKIVEVVPAPFFYLSHLTV